MLYLHIVFQCATYSQISIFLANIDAAVPVVNNPEPANAPQRNHEFMLPPLCRLFVEIEGTGRQAWWGILNSGQRPTWMNPQHTGPHDTDIKAYIALPFRNHVYTFTATLHNNSGDRFDSYVAVRSRAYIRGLYTSLKAELIPTTANHREETYIVPSIYVRISNETFLGGWLSPWNGARPDWVM